MKRFTSWIRNAVSPNRSEIQRMENILPPKIIEYCRDATEPNPEEIACIVTTRSAAADAFRAASEPTDAAVARLLAQLPRQPQRVSAPWRPIALGSMAAMAAAAVAWVGLSLFVTEGYGTSPLSVGLQHQIQENHALQFGPSIDMTASASLQVIQADEDATVIQLNEGSTHFEVDPAGDYRHLTVTGAGVEVIVRGTVFDVHRDGDNVLVEVMRGAVEVRHDHQSIMVLAGDSWTNKPKATASLPAPDPSVERIQAPPAPKVEPETEPVNTKLAKRKAVTPEPPTESEKDKETDEPGLLIQPDTLAFHKIMTAREAGANPEAIEKLVGEFVKEFPDSFHINAAREISVQAIIRSADKRRAVETVTAWLADERKAGRLSKHRENHYRSLRATVLRDSLNDCEAALKDYEFLSQNARGQARAEAFAWAGVCASGLGQTEKALNAFSQADLNSLQPTLRKEVEERMAALKSDL